MSTDYVIVEFKDLSCQCIPTNWVSECKLFCLYPNVSSFKVNDLVKRKAIPSNDKTWERYEIRILGSADSYEKGRRKAAKAEFTSNLDTDDDSGSRKRRTIREIQSSSSDSSPVAKKSRKQPSKLRCSRTKKIKPTVLFPIQNEPSLPLHQTEGLQASLNSTTSTQPNSSQHVNSAEIIVSAAAAGFCLAPGSGTNASLETSADTSLFAQNQMPTPPVVPIASSSHAAVSNNQGLQTSTNDNRTSSQEKATDNNIIALESPLELSDFQTTVLRALSTIQRDIRNLYAITSQRSEYRPTTDVLPVSLPVNSRDDFIKINEWLVQKENRSKLFDILRLIGGETKEAVVRNILVRIIGPVLNKILNWSGKFCKLKLKETNLHATILDSVRHNPIAKDITDEEIKRTLKSWLSGLKDRDGGRERRRNEVRQNGEEED